MGEVGETPQTQGVLVKDSTLVESTPRIPIHPKAQKYLDPGTVLGSEKTYTDPEQQMKQDVRAFSKSTKARRQARSRAASEIKGLRQTEEAEKKRIDEIQHELSTNRNLTWPQRDRLRESIQRYVPGKYKDKAKQYSREFNKSRQYNLNDARNIDELERYIDEKGQVEDLAEMGLYVVHGIKPGLGGWSSPVVSKDWRDKLANVIDLKSAVSASSIARGRDARLWYPFGLVYRSGRVSALSTTDLGTGAEGLKERTASNAVSSTIKGYEEVISLHQNRPRDRYNEIILEGNPDSAGLFISLDESRKLARENEVIIGLNYIDQPLYGGYGPRRVLRFTEIFNEARRYGMKVFVFKEGIAYEAAMAKNGTLILGKEVSPQEMIEQRYEIPLENREGIHQQAVKTVPPEILQQAA